MSLSPEELVQQIHDSPTRIVLAASGGGSRAIADLLEVPGASRTLLEAAVPYAAPAMIAWLGGAPDEFCSAVTARAMAMAAFHRSRRYAPAEATLAGVACTASLASDRPKRGAHRAHLAVQTAVLTATWELQLQKDRRSRVEEERLVGRLLLNVIAAACDVHQRLALDLLENEQVQEAHVAAPPAWQDLLVGRVESIRVGPDIGAPSLVMPGAFNPLHVGHRRMLQIAQELLQRPAAVEISILNVDKLPLDYMEIHRRLDQFPVAQTIYLTRAATFEEKSRLFPGATFVVGTDTLERIAAPQYYGGDPGAGQDALERIAALGCRFLVFGRKLREEFVRLGNLVLPEKLRKLCDEVPPEVFREDISSRGDPEVWIAVNTIKPRLGVRGSTALAFMPHFDYILSHETTNLRRSATGT